MCKRCSSLKTLPIVEDMEYVTCHDCPSLTTIPKIEGYICEFILHNCPLVTVIPNICTVMLECYNCPLLISISEDDEPPLIVCHKCKWLDYNNPEYKNNLSNLITIQKYFRKYRKIKKMKRWLNSHEFNDWYYSPGNPGGKRAIARINKTQYKISLL